jgi:hypothetical protein
MHTRRLAVNWILGSLLIAFVLWGYPALTAGSAYERQVAALRADSAAAFHSADSARRARGEEAVAYVFTPPDPLGYERKRVARTARARIFTVSLIGASLLWSTVVWAWSRRRSAAVAT